jgi:hypothetical protein
VRPGGLIHAVHGYRLELLHRPGSAAGELLHRPPGKPRSSA